jgi:hypothetical protein
MPPENGRCRAQVGALIKIGQLLESAEALMKTAPCRAQPVAR